MGINMFKSIIIKLNVSSKTITKSPQNLQKIVKLLKKLTHFPFFRPILITLLA